MHDAGVALSHLQEDGADNWTEQPSSHAVDLPGIDIPQFDYACSPYLHETQDASKTGNTCGLFGDNEVCPPSIASPQISVPHDSHPLHASIVSGHMTEARQNATAVQPTFCTHAAGDWPTHLLFLTA